MVTKTEKRSGLDLRLAREEAGLQQAEVAARLRPPIDVKLLTYWERGQALPTESQLRQLRRLYRAQLDLPLPKLAQPPGFDRRKPWSQNLSPSDFAHAMKTLQRRLGVPTEPQLAKLLGVPLKTVTSAHREELPTHLKAVIAAVLGWERVSGTVYGLLSVTQRRKLDAIQSRLGQAQYFVARSAPSSVPGSTRRALEGAPYAWRKARKAEERESREMKGDSNGRPGPPSRAKGPR